MPLKKRFSGPRRKSGSGQLVLITLVLSTLFNASCANETPRRIRQTPIIIISIDTLRADRLPAYGYRAVSTPAIDLLTADGIVFENAYAHVPLTLPSHVSLLTGKLPAAHGVRNNLGYRFDAAAHQSIPSFLKNKGYATAAAVSSYVLRSSTGIGPAFGHYDDAMDKTEGSSIDELQRSGWRTIAAAQSWLDANRDAPFFFLLHLYEPHAPYQPPEPFRTRYKGREYDGEIAAADAILGNFIAFLKQRAIYDDATIFLLSDHGEGLGDHGEGEHGIFLYREAIRVPLVVKLPRGGRRRETRITTPVQLIDVFPTIAAMTGTDVPRGLEGRSLLAIADGERPNRRIFSESMYPRIHLGLSDLASLVDAAHHYIDAPTSELYELGIDPQEKRNALNQHRRVFTAMRGELDAFRRPLVAPSEVSAEEQAKLAALGYLTTPIPVLPDQLADPKDHIRDLETAAEAALLVESGRAEEAIPMLRGLVARNPRFADGWTRLGKAYERTGRLEESIVAYRRTIEIAPLLTRDCAISLAETFLILRRIDESIAHATLATETHPGAAHAVLAKAFLAKRDLLTAEREAQWLIADPSRHVDGIVMLAQIRIAQNRLGDAASLVAGARAQRAETQTVPMLAFVEGDIHARKGELAQAKRSFLAETMAFPRNREAFVRLAVLQTLQGEVTEAEQTFERMVSASGDPSSVMLAADTFAALGQRAAAARWRARMHRTNR